ncbi:MAG: hypothetical protein Q8P41_11490 [Pseudomonadota bacterium]|nr:hypothetical protein [Pseudomonadota bacterium]
MTGGRSAHAILVCGLLLAPACLTVRSYPDHYVAAARARLARCLPDRPMGEQWERAERDQAEVMARDLTPFQPGAAALCLKELRQTPCDADPPRQCFPGFFEEID